MLLLTLLLSLALAAFFTLLPARVLHRRTTRADLYAGAGTISGHNYSLWHKGWGGKGVAVTCTWLILYLPVTGALCCLAGGLAVLGLGYLPLGAVLIPTLAVPIAWVQYGPESGIILLLAAAMMFWRHKNGLHRIFLGQEKQFFRPKS